MSEKQQSGNGNEVVLEVESEEIVNEAKVDYLPVSTESSTSGYHSSDNISRFSNVPIPNETSLSRSKSSNSLGQQSKRIDSDIVGDSNLEQDITSPDNKSEYTDDEEEEEEEIYKKVNLIKKVKYKKMMEWIVFLCSLGVLVASFTVEKLENFKVWGLEIWKWCVLAMLLFCGMLITNCVVHILVFLIEKNILFRKKVLYFVHLMKKSVQVFVWWGLVLLTWLLLFNRRIERSKTLAKISDHITGTLVALLIGALLWLLTKLLFRILASKYMETYCNRIERCLSYKRVIETLSGPPLVNKSPTLTPQMVWEGKRGHWKGKEVTGRAKRSLTPQMVSVETMDTLVDAISWNIRLPRNKEIYSEKDAEAAASHILRKVAKRGFK